MRLELLPLVQDISAEEELVEVLKQTAASLLPSYATTPIPDAGPEWVLCFPDHSCKIPDMDQNPDRTVPDEYLPLTEAAQRLDIAYDTARKRLKAGTLEGERRDGRWYVLVPGPESRPEGGPEPKPNQSGEQSEDSGHIPDATEPIPDALVALLERQTHRIAELSAAAALWQERARFLGERLAALEAGPIAASAPSEAANAPQDAQDAPGRAAPLETTSRTLREVHVEPVPAEVQLATGWRRWFRWLMES